MPTKIKPKPRTEEYFSNTTTGANELLNFCKNIKYGEIYEVSQVLEYIGIREGMWRRMNKRTDIIHPYTCYMRGRRVTAALVHPKHKLELVKSHLAFERHFNGIDAEKTNAK